MASSLHHKTVPALETLVESEEEDVVAGQSSKTIDAGPNSRKNTESDLEVKRSIPTAPVDVSNLSKPTSASLLTPHLSTSSVTPASANHDPLIGIALPKSDPAPSSSQYRPDLHLEMMSLSAANDMKNTTGHTPHGYSLRHRSLRSLSLAEKIAGSIRHQQDMEGMMTGNGAGGNNNNNTGDGQGNQQGSDKKDDSYSSGGEIVDELQEELKEKAVLVIRRVRDKLTGLDFYPVQHTGNGKIKSLEVHEQVDKLIQQATSNELLCQGFFGWCPFW